MYKEIRLSSLLNLICRITWSAQHGLTTWTVFGFQCPKRKLSSPTNTRQRRQERYSTWRWTLSNHINRRKKNRTRQSVESVKWLTDANPTPYTWHSRSIQNSESLKKPMLQNLNGWQRCRRLILDFHIYNNN